MLTFKVLGGQDDGSKVVVLNKGADLGRHLGAVPAHDEHLANGPGQRSMPC